MNTEQEKEKQWYFGRSDISAYEQNPFAAQLIEEVQPRKKTVAFAGRGALVDKETGEQMGDMAVIGIQRAVDSAGFIKFYEAGIREAFGLKPAALKVLSVMLEAYRSTDTRQIADRLYINFKIATNDYGYAHTRQTFTTGVNELLKKNFIAQVKDQKHWFFINPVFFFKGDRLRIVHEFITDRPARKVERDTKTLDMFTE